MKQTLRRWLARPAGLVKAWRDQCLERLRAHVALALADDFRNLAERDQRQLAKLRADFDRRFDEMVFVSESLILETIRLQRQLADYLPPGNRSAEVGEVETYDAEKAQRAA
jgi:hypothetical protein